MKVQRITFVAFGLTFLALYLAVMARPFEFEEIRLTSLFHSTVDEDLRLFVPELSNKSRFEQMATDYIKLNPPGLLYFYRLWSLLTNENEFLMRLPLFIMVILSLKSLYQIFLKTIGAQEAILYLFFIGVMPIWFRPMATLNPASFNLCFTILAINSFWSAWEKGSFNGKALWSINILGLLNSYHFLPIVLFQVLASFFKKGERAQKSYAIFFGCLTLLVPIIYFSIPQPSEVNPIVFYWGEVSNIAPFHALSNFFMGRDL